MFDKLKSKLSELVTPIKHRYDLIEKGLVVKQNGNALGYVPEELNGIALLYVPTELKTEELCLGPVKIKPVELLSDVESVENLPSPLKL